MGSFQGPNQPSGSYSGNAMLDMMVQMFGSKLLPPGMVLGQWNPNQPLGDTLEAREFGQGQMGAAMGLGGPAATQHVQELIQGRAGSTNGGLVGMGVLDESIFGAGNLQTEDISKAVGAAMPYLSMASPQLLDMMGPGAGMSGMGSNYASMMRGNGLNSGQLTDRAVTLGQDVSSQLYGGNSGDFSQTMGIGYSEGSALLRGAGNMGIAPTGAQLLGMGRTEAREAASKATMDLSHGSAAIRDLGGHYAAMNPEQRMTTLDQLSMGRLSAGENAAGLGMQVRQFKQTTRAAGLSLGEGQGLMQIAGARSAALGGNMQSGTVGGSHAAAYGAFLNSDKGAGYVSAAGVSSNTLLQQDAVLTAQAGRSNTAANASALMEMGEAGMLEGEALKKYESLKEGKYEAMGDGAFRSMLKKSGMNMNVAGTIMSNREENLANHGDSVAGAVRGSQWNADIAPSMQRDVANAMGAAGGGAFSTKQTMNAGAMVAETLKGMGGKSRKEMIDAVAAKYQADGMNEQQAQNAARVSVSAAGMSVRKKGYKGGIGHAVSLHGDEVAGGVADQEGRAATKAQEEADTADQGQKGPWARLADGIKDGTKSAAEFFAKVIGGVKKPASGSGDTDASGSDSDGSGGIPKVKIDGTVSVVVHGAGDVPDTGSGMGSTMGP